MTHRVFVFKVFLAVALSPLSFFGTPLRYLPALFSPVHTHFFLCLVPEIPGIFE